jgi:hypothetical protein
MRQCIVHPLIVESRAYDETQHSRGSRNEHGIEIVISLLCMYTNVRPMLEKGDTGNRD